MAHPEWDDPAPSDFGGGMDNERAKLLAEALVNQAKLKAGINPHPTRLMRILLAVREVALIIWLTIFSVLGILALSFLAEFASALDDATEPAPNPIVTECVGEIC